MIVIFCKAHICWSYLLQWLTRISHTVYTALTDAARKLHCVLKRRRGPGPLWWSVTTEAHSPLGPVCAHQRSSERHIPAAATGMDQDGLWRE